MHRGRTPRLHAHHRRKGGLLRGLLQQVRRHPFAAGAAVAAVGWLFGGDHERREASRPRRATRAQKPGAGRAIDGEASHG
jgi:hypothetical protein